MGAWPSGATRPTEPAAPAGPRQASRLAIALSPCPARTQGGRSRGPEAGLWRAGPRLTRPFPPLQPPSTSRFASLQDSAPAPGGHLGVRPHRGNLAEDDPGYFLGSLKSVCKSDRPSHPSHPLTSSQKTSKVILNPSSCSTESLLKFVVHLFWPVCAATSFCHLSLGCLLRTVPNAGPWEPMTQAPDQELEFGGKNKSSVVMRGTDPI